MFTKLQYIEPLDQQLLGSVENINVYIDSENNNFANTYEQSNLRNTIYSYKLQFKK